MRGFSLALALAVLTVPAQAVAQERSPNPKAPSLPGSPQPGSPQPGSPQPGSPAPGSPVPEQGSTPAVSPEPSAIEAGDSAPADSVDERLQLLEQELAEVRERLERAEDARQQSAVSPLSISGYVDLGFFAPLGNGGVGWVRDVANRQRPDLDEYAWTFLGDILGSPINSRGEAADLGDAPGADRFDSVDSDGAPGFIVNEVNLNLGYTLAEDAIMRASLNFLPRSATQDFSFGDFVEVDIAELEYVLTSDGQTSLFVGKILPVFGIEYVHRKSDQRFGITPSLIARYTTGPQLGAKIRSKLFDGWLILAGAVTNNTSTVEQFHFYREIDRNAGKTLNGRVALSIPLTGIEALENDRIELGASAQWGAQDNDTQSDREIWFIGADLQYQSTNFSIKAQVMQGNSPANEDGEVWGLDLDPSGYVELDWQAHPRFGFLLRADFRDAFVHLGTERAYFTNQARFTGGLRWLFNPHIVAKAEYYHNQELAGIDQFDNDMITSSLLLMY